MSNYEISAPKMYQWLLFGVISAVTVAMTLLGQLPLLVILAVGILFVVYSFREPLPALFLWYLSGSDFLAFISIERLGIQLAPGIRININDFLFVLLLSVAAYHLFRRRERLLFATPMTAWMLMLGISFFLTILQGHMNLDTGPQELRRSIGYASYFIYVACLDSPKRFRAVINFWLILLVAAVSIQIAEFALHQRFPALPGFEQYEGSYHSRLVEVNVGGMSTPYIWPRADITIGLYLSLGALFEGRRRKTFLFLAVAGILSTMLMLIRQEYVGLAAGLIFLLIVRQKRIKTVAIVAVIIICFVLIASVVGLFISSSSQGSLWAVWIARTSTLLNFSKDANFIGRVDTISRQLDALREAPLFGLGLGWAYQPLWSTDIGMMNTLVKYGLVGTSVIGFVIFYVMRLGFRLYRRLPASIERGFVLGLIALLVSRLVMYPVGTDSFTSGAVVAVIMGVIDRVAAFSYTDTPAT